MELRHLITFRTIVEKGGFKKAADALGYAQSSVTGHIRELEEELGHPLFDRLGRSISLTQAGRSFFPYALEIIKLYAQSKEVIHASNEPSGQLIIGASESVMIHWLPAIMMELMEQYPKVELILKSIDYDNLFTQLKNGDIDVAILVELSNWNRDDLNIAKIRDEKLSLVQSTNRGNNPHANRMLVTELACSWRPAIDEYLHGIGNNAMPVIELPSIEAIKKCILCGMGQSMLPHFVIKDEIENGLVEEKRLNVNAQSLSLYAVMHKDKWISPNLKVFLQEVNDNGSFDTVSP
ncbi:LysR family transcriptional regulator [Gracilibacillus caseinilyticus]|uniref:LysR family transcriptional regulator n=1 Tax=Gracilibacillus caseinilyticus TaxID=2932256 RepID=A0ABY4EZ55_9BACI|nr:LysR family transcriptional regulator [Gracilibacillus caseinilyticus]UOQ49687.1 LysR family transcriptional regulator [Gracilibacillus caseinilyticus]